MTMASYRGSVFVISQPDYDSENVDSVWLTEEEALSRAAQVGQPFIEEFRIGTANAWVRNGWYPPNGKPRCWSDWGWKGVKL